MEGGIQEFYNGKSILITGFTGFMGKILAEKLLRSCHQINKVYVLIRGKRNKTFRQRFEDVIKIQLFDRLKSEKPGVLESKLVPMNGDIGDEELGLSQEDRELLRSEVGVVFHVAATVRFNEPLTSAVKQNTVGTSTLVQLALTMPNLKGFVHVSSTYCNCDRDVVEEVMYPEHADWRMMQSIIDNIDPTIVNVMGKKYIGNLPNAYIFSKSMAEHVVWEQRYKIPVVILRPSIVVSTLNDPVPGWVDTYNGPIGITSAIGQGIIRTAFLDNSITPDFMAADLAIKGIIVAAWARAMCKDPDEKCHIYNASSQKKSLTCKQMIEIGLDAINKYPLENSVWHYSKHLTNSIFWFTINVWLFHVIPALIIDSILKMTGKKPM
ncbi:hypothetical protein AAG570_006849 [Ranatra chinensis]|uniref:Fatty acyl-CoA reductase n=1 Tax=Ranatra chinensis TaxID=642074 RepID=A0ABD0Z5T3_9HEMI